MFKKVAFFVLLFALVMGSVNASSMNGDYNGHPIVKITTGGVLNKKEIQTEIPAFIYEGNTMVPIAALKELGASVTWDGNTYTVNVVIPQQAKNPNIDMLVLAKLLEKNSVSHIEYLAITENTPLTRLSMYYKGTFLDTKYTQTDFLDILSTGSITDAMVIQVTDAQGTVMWAYNTYVKEYVSGKVAYDEFKKNLHISTAPSSTQQISPSASSTKSYPYLYSNDGKTFLGSLDTNKYNKDSIFNEYGTYGSKYNANSIWNTYGDYGSEYSNTSAFNKYATKPPLIVSDSKTIGYLTVNTTLKGAVSPVGILEWLKKQGY